MGETYTGYGRFTPEDSIRRRVGDLRRDDMIPVGVVTAATDTECYRCATELGPKDGLVMRNRSGGGYGLYCEFCQVNRG